MVEPFGRRLTVAFVALVLPFVALWVVRTGAPVASGMSPGELKAHCEQLRRQYRDLEALLQRIVLVARLVSSFYE